MNSQKVYKIFFLLYFISFIAIWMGCDKIEQPYKESGNSTSDTTACPLPTFDVQPIVKKVLLEEFTGHTCGNCPASHDISSSLKQMYGNRLILIAVHTGSFALPKNYADGSFAYDFRSPCGEELNNSFGNDAAGLPNGMIDRKKVNGNEIIRPSAWGTEIQKSLGNAPLAGLQIINNYEASSGKLCTAVQTAFTNAIQGTYQLMIYLTEDSIINWQKDYRKNPENIPDYVHRHVLRQSINGTFGETIARGQLLKGHNAKRSYKIQLKSTFNPLKCSIIAILKDSTTSEIIQVEEEKITP